MTHRAAKVGAQSLKDLPASKEAIEKQLGVIREVKAREDFEDIKRSPWPGSM